MTKRSLTHSEYLYEIRLEQLEKARSNLESTHSVLYFLSEWILESPNCSLEIKDKSRLDAIICLLSDLVDSANNALPLP